MLNQAGNLCQIDELEPPSTDDLSDSKDLMLTELVFIGVKLPRKEILNELNTC
jgi:hypothetical protein